MKTYKKKGQSLFLSQNDEKSFENQLRNRLDDILFIDGVRWPSPNPPTKRAISECASPIVYIWNKKLAPTLPFIRLDSDRYQGPSSGIVIQFVRCRLQDGILNAGESTIAYDVADNGIADFVAAVWKVLKRLNTGPLEFVSRSTNEVVNTNIREFVVGEDAKRISKSGTLLCDGRTDFFYRVHDQ